MSHKCLKLYLTFLKISFSSHWIIYLQVYYHHFQQIFYFISDTEFSFLKFPMLLFVIDFISAKIFTYTVISKILYVTGHCCRSLYKILFSQFNIWVILKQVTIDFLKMYGLHCPLFFFIHWVILNCISHCDWYSLETIDSVISSVIPFFVLWGTWINSKLDKFNFLSLQQKLQ